MKFFIKDDFVNFGEEDWRDPCVIKPQVAADKANAKLESEGHCVYGKGDYRLFSFCGDKNLQFKDGSYPTHKALLICVEPIEKCTHPKEKVQEIIVTEGYEKKYGNMIPVYKDESYKCECGAKVKPSSFEEI